jgi:hypothetical protein
MRYAVSFTPKQASLKQTVIRTSLILLLLLLSAKLFSQSKHSFHKLIKQTNHFLAAYAQLSTGNDLIPKSSLGLSKGEIVRMKKSFDTETNDKNLKDSVSSTLAIEYVQRTIIGLMMHVFSHPEFPKNDIQKLIRGKDCSIIKSDDNKLFNFTLDEKTGGTYRSSLPLMHFTDIENLYSAGFEAFQSFFDTDGYDSIYTLQTGEGIKYLLKSSVRGCSNCLRNSVELIKFSDNAFTREFEFANESRDWNDGIYYDPPSKTIHVNYHLDDLSPVCSCETDSREEDNSKTEEGEETVGEKNLAKAATADLFLMERLLSWLRKL